MDNQDPNSYSVDFVQILMKYFILGGSVALAVSILPKSKMSGQEVLSLALTASVVFLILDTYAPSISIGARHGAGFGIGTQLVGGLGGAGVVSGKEGFNGNGNGNGNSALFETSLNGATNSDYKAADATHLQGNFRNNLLTKLNDKAVENEMYRYNESKGKFSGEVTSSDLHPAINSGKYTISKSLDKAFLKPENHGQVLMEPSEEIEGFTESYKLNRMSRLNKVGKAGVLKNSLLKAQSL